MTFIKAKTKSEYTYDARAFEFAEVFQKEGGGVKTVTLTPAEMVMLLDKDGSGDVDEYELRQGQRELCYSYIGEGAGETKAYLHINNVHTKDGDGKIVFVSNDVVGIRLYDEPKKSDES